MAKDLIYRGAAADDGTGDTLRPGAEKINAMFDEVYAGARWYSIISRSTPTAQPVSPSDGDTYIIPAGATGADWAGNDGALAIYSSDQAAWIIFTPDEGVGGWIADEDIAAVWNGSAWYSAKEVPLTDGATITPDFATGFNFAVTLGGDRTLANPTNAKAGQTGRINIIQDGTGTRLISTWGSNWKFPGGAPTLTTTAGAIDKLVYEVQADGTIHAALTADYQ